MAFKGSVDLDAVNSYVLERIRAKGDVFGWSVIESETRPTALILIADEAPQDSFPRTIGDVAIELRRVSAPKEY